MSMRRLSNVLLIFAIGIWGGVGVNLLNAAVPSKVFFSQKVETNRHPSHGRNLIMNNRDFQYLYKVLKKKSFNSDRLELLSVGVLDNYFSCRQCAKIMSLCSFDGDRLEVFEIMVGHLVDLENADIIIESLNFKSNQEKAVKLLEKEIGGYSNNVRETQVKWGKD